MDNQERKKRVRPDQGDQDKTKTKLSKRQSEQQDDHDHHHHHDHDHDHDPHHRDDISDGVFDFPWLKDGDGVASRSDDQWKKLDEDSFVSQLGDHIKDYADMSAATITTPTGIEFSFSGQCLLSPTSDIIPVADDFPDDKFGYGDELSPTSSLLDDYFGFEAAESLDCIWSAFS